MTLSPQAVKQIEELGIKVPETQIDETDPFKLMEAAFETMEKAMDEFWKGAILTNCQTGQQFVIKNNDSTTLTVNPYRWYLKLWRKFSNWVNLKRGW